MGVCIDVFVKILDLMNKEGRKENSNPKKRERELYSRLKIASYNEKKQTIHVRYHFVCAS